MNTTQTHFIISNVESEMPSFKDKANLKLVNWSRTPCSTIQKFPQAQKSWSWRFASSYNIVYNFYNIAKKYERRSSFFLLFLCSS